MKVVFFGSSFYVVPIIENLHKSFDLVLVVTTEQNPTDPIPNYCKTQNIQVLSIQKIDKETMEKIQQQKPAIGVLASFRIILKHDILALFPNGIVNIHPSLLPCYRGTTPVQTAILNGDAKTGVTIMKLEKQFDQGPILSQIEEPIYTNDTSESLYTKLFEIGAKQLIKILPVYIAGKLPLTNQLEVKAIYTKRLTREDGYIDLSNPPKKDILERMIRAYCPWPGVYAKLKMKNEKVKIIKFLPGERIQVEGKRPMSVKDFFNGYPKAKELIEKLL